MFFLINFNLTNNCIISSLSEHHCTMYSGEQISLDSNEIKQLFDILKFIFFLNVNGMRVDIFNKRYAFPSFLQVVSPTLAWIRSSLNTFLPVLHHGTRP